MSNELGKFLKYKRGEKSLRDFANFLGMSHSHLDSLEKGYDPKTKKEITIGVDLMQNISKKTGVSVDTILDMISGTPFEQAIETAKINQDYNDGQIINNYYENKEYIFNFHLVNPIEEIKKDISNLSEEEISKDYKTTIINTIDYYHDLTKKNNDTK